VHDDLHAPFAPQTYPLQSLDPAAEQAPVPLHCAAGVKVDPMQVAFAHTVVVSAFWQAPAPLQAPVNPQGGLALQRLCGSVVPSGTLAQLPGLPTMLHAWHIGQDAEAQQTPSTQLRPCTQGLLLLQV
jgi:hypothetical protein